MARFRFSLEAVLRARVRTERDRQCELAAIQRERTELLETLRRQQARIDEARDALRDRLTGTLHAAELRLHAGAVLQDMRAAQRNARALAAMQQRLDVAREALVQARRERRAIEMLRERRYEQWRAEEGRREQQELDELAARRRGPTVQEQEQKR